jgi:hypothetical protein
MSDLETEFSDSASPFEEKSSHFTQAGQLNDPSLSQLRDQIKKVMIPLLIKTFQFKLELNQSQSVPSRLQSLKNQRSPEEIFEQLKTLDNDLKVLLLWCQSCRCQIQKALLAPEEEQKKTIGTTSTSEANPAVSKSFTEAIAAKSSFFQQRTPQEKEKELPSNPSADAPTPKWWQKLLKK